MNLILKIQKFKSPQISESDGCSDTRIVIKTEGFGTREYLIGHQNMSLRPVYLLRE